MKRYVDLLDYCHDSMCARERLEWSNFWYDSTNKDVKKRILLIGDSTVRMIRSTFAEKTGYAVDMLGSSSGLHDILFQKQVDIFFSSEQYKYDIIYIQMGHHSRINDKGEEYTDADYAQFKKDYQALIDFLSQYCNNIVLLTIFYSVIPKKKYRGYLQSAVNIMRHYQSEIYDDAVNRIKKGKNDLIVALAEENELKYCDINKIMLNTIQHRKTRFIHTDHVHYEDRAKGFIVDQYIPFL